MVTLFSILGFVGFSILWIWFSLRIFKSPSKVPSTVISTGTVDVLAKGNTTLSIPSQFTINLIQDVPVLDEGLFDFSVRISDLVSGDYRFPRRFLKGYDPLKDFDPPEETPKQQKPMDVMSCDVDIDNLLTDFFHKQS